MNKFLSLSAAIVLIVAPLIANATRSELVNSDGSNTGTGNSQGPSNVGVTLDWLGVGGTCAVFNGGQALESLNDPKFCESVELKREATQIVSECNKQEKPCASRACQILTKCQKDKIAGICRQCNTYSECQRYPECRSAPCLRNCRTIAPPGRL